MVAVMMGAVQAVMGVLLVAVSVAVLHGTNRAEVSRRAAVGLACGGCGAAALAASVAGVVLVPEWLASLAVVCGIGVLCVPWAALKV